MWSVVFLIPGLLMLLLAALQTKSFFEYCKRQKKRGRKVPRTLSGITWLLYLCGAVFLLLSLVIGMVSPRQDTPEPPPETTGESQPPAPEFLVTGTAGTDPLNWQIRWEIFENGILKPSYRREEPISFGDPEDYFSLPGVSTFRGNNYRNSASYGTASIVEKKIKTLWTHDTGTIKGGSWSGNGWTGQPLIVQWDKETRQIMNLYADKKNKDDLVEVIYASLDGRIYFMDLADGSDTRDPLDIGLCFKGAGSLDPRGYPLLYVGQGISRANGRTGSIGWRVYSLIDQRELFFLDGRDPLSAASMRRKAAFLSGLKKDNKKTA